MPESDNVADSPKWSVTPKYLLRRDCVVRRTRSWAPGDFVECGAGTGNFTRVFLDRGFFGHCYDLSDENRRTIERNLAAYDNVEVIDSLADLGDRQFPYLVSVEVLEHIEDDEAALRRWSRFLRPGGKILLTVPAHQRKFGPDDRQMGHVRRYEKLQLAALLERCGYHNIEIVNYGFPLGNITRVVRDAMLRRSRPDEETDPVELSKRSGRSRPPAILKLSFLFRNGLIWPFLLMQRWTWHRDWGDGYVATAEKR